MKLKINKDHEEALDNMSKVYGSSEVFYDLPNAIEFDLLGDPKLDLAYQKGAQDLCLVLGQIIADRAHSIT